MTNPTHEDYAISAREAIKINARATGSAYYLSSDDEDGMIVESEDHMMLAICAYGLEPTEKDRTLQAIAHNHNVLPALARRLMEAEEAILFWQERSKPRLQNFAEEQEKYWAEEELIELADRIKAGRAEQDAIKAED